MAEAPERRSSGEWLQEATYAWNVADTRQGELSGIGAALCGLLTLVIEIREEDAHRNVIFDLHDKADAALGRVLGLADWCESEDRPDMAGRIRAAVDGTTWEPPPPTRPRLKPDVRELDEDVTGHVLGPNWEHDDRRYCGWHNRLKVWVVDGRQCLRDHPDVVEIRAAHAQKPNA